MQKEEKQFQEYSPYYIGVPTIHQAHFTMMAVFKEKVSYRRNYTCPFNMIDIFSEAEGEDSAVIRNLQTGETYSIEENMITMCPYNLPQNYLFTLRNEHLCIHFTLELFPGVDIYSGQEHMYVEHSPEQTRRAKEIFEVEDPVLRLSLCQEFALAFCHRHWPERYAFEMEPAKRFSEVLEYVRLYATAQTSIWELAKIMHMQDSAFSREFYETFHIHPKKFLQKEIFYKSVRLLLTPGVSIKETALRLKFSSEFNFSRFFKRISGFSPTEYKSYNPFNLKRK